MIVKGKILKQGLKIFKQPSERDVQDVEYFWTQITDPYQSIQDEVTRLERQLVSILRNKNGSEKEEAAAMLHNLRQREAKVVGLAVDETVNVVNIYEGWIIERCDKLDKLCQRERIGIFSKPKDESLEEIKRLWDIIVPYQSTMKGAEKDLSDKAIRIMADMARSSEREAFMEKLRNIRKIEKSVESVDNDAVEQNGVSARGDYTQIYGAGCRPS
ncbi:hypothetical protein BDV96DRAFT_608040 [Lophiotrema nucula]|uniref:Uncharacterized protein n=1 Tax=Lophiotrema nucula TaxID=690887 RepID=A0A6A5YFE3_9PLEO|nr:hypothetical protein BDV96DRAFT_608040 [Lophiotrema nucula]